MAGAQTLYKETQPCYIIGFTKVATADASDVKSLPFEDLSKFASSVYCKDPAESKACIVFLASEIPDQIILPEVQLVEVHQLSPLTSNLGKHRSILYTREVIANLLEVLNIATDEKTPLVIL